MDCGREGGRNPGLRRESGLLAGPEPASSSPADDSCRYGCDPAQGTYRDPVAGIRYGSQEQTPDGTFGRTLRNARDALRPLRVMGGPTGQGMAGVGLLGIVDQLLASHVGVKNAGLCPRRLSSPLRSQRRSAPTGPVDPTEAGPDPPQSKRLQGLYNVHLDEH